MKKNTLDISAIRQLHQAGKLDEAKKAYLALLKVQPNEVEALHGLAIIAAQEEKFEEAIEYIQTAIKYAPDKPTLRLHLANILKIQGLYSQSTEVLQEVIKHHPDYIPALNNLGTVYYAQGKLEDAIYFYRQAVQKKPDYIDAYYNLGLALAKEKKYDEAILSFQTILSLTPDHFAARYHLACTLMQTNQLDKARELFLEIEKKFPNHFETQMNFAVCCLQLGALNEAKEHYLKALDIVPDDAQIFFNLGVINMQQGFIDSAIQNYQRAVQINPDFFAAHNNLGIAFIAKQHVGLALQHFQEALRLKPKNPAINYTVQALLKNQHLLTAPPDYITSLFDAYADHYDAHLLNALDYKVPSLLYDAVTKISSDKKLDILDLGCGTGLCGVQFQTVSKSLTGIDLSQKMLDVAATKNIYTDLQHSDLLDFLKNKKSAFDLVLAGDVLVYIGELNDIFSAIYDALRDGGLFAFNTEITEKNNFFMNQSGRFAHHKNYLDALAEKYHFKMAFYEVVMTRMQNNEPVYGHLTVLQK